MTNSERGAIGPHPWLGRLARAALGKPRIARVDKQSTDRGERGDKVTLAGGYEELRARIERRTAAKSS